MAYSGIGQVTSVCQQISESAKGLENLLAGTADGAFPVIRKIVKLGSFGNFSLSVAFVRVVDISAIDGLTLPHFFRFCHLVSFLQKRGIWQSPGSVMGKKCLSSDENP